MTSILVHRYLTNAFGIGFNCIIFYLMIELSSLTNGVFIEAIENSLNAHQKFNLNQTTIENSKRLTMATDTTNETIPPFGNAHGNVLPENASLFFQYHNISRENLKEFLQAMAKLQNRTHVERPTEDDSCQYYCKGFIKDLFGSYSNVHGYISLVVSIEICLNDKMTFNRIFLFRFDPYFRFRFVFFYVILGLHIRYNCQYSQYYCFDTKRHGQITNK